MLEEIILTYLHFDNNYQFSLDHIRIIITGKYTGKNH